MDLNHTLFSDSVWFFDRTVQEKDVVPEWCVYIYITYVLYLIEMYIKMLVFWLDIKPFKY